MSNESANDPQAISVTQLLRRLRNLLEVQIGQQWVEGEVSNLRRQPSGHWYFSLKDERAQISCAMFGAKNRQGADMIEDGVMVRVFADVSVYEARGQLQVIVSKVLSVGAGHLQAKLEALKAKLQREGLFEASRKQSIPRFPRSIGLITSGSGAALQDMLNVLSRRAPWVQPVLMPVRVQGKGAEREIASAIERMGCADDYGLPLCDLLIVGRGGGSLEDLWNFNEEIVARAIAACPLPVISAVGHEIDFTIADFVADLRAPTPSAAMELAVVDSAELSEKLEQSLARLQRLARERIKHLLLRLQSLCRSSLWDGEKLLREPVMRLDAARCAIQMRMRTSYEDHRARLRYLSAMHRARHPRVMLGRRIDTVKVLKARMVRSTLELLDDRNNLINQIKDLLRALGPESAFQRGFSITLNSAGGIVRSAGDLSKGQQIKTKFLDGEVESEVI